MADSIVCEAPRVKLGKSALHLLHRADQCALSAFYVSIDRQALTPRQYVVLSMIGEEGGISQAALVQRTAIDRSTLSDIVRRLERKGLLLRQRKAEDARAYAIELTESGREALALAEPVVRAAEERLLAALPEGGVELFKESLKRIADYCEAAPDGALDVSSKEV
jgi:DNA-binding MarR family transcriptional regulator